MKRKMKVVLLLGTLVTGVAVAGGFGYHRACADPQAHAAAITKEIAEQLQLTAEQMTKLDAVKDDLIAKGQAFHAAHDQTRERVIQLLAQPSLDQTAILGIVQERTAALNDSAAQAVIKIAAFYDSLDDAQRSKLRERFADRMADPHHSHGW
jgi:Spy/CpxP family protein refolding chaperone